MIEIVTDVLSRMGQVLLSSIPRLECLRIVHFHWKSSKVGSLEWMSFEVANEGFHSNTSCHIPCEFFDEPCTFYTSVFGDVRISLEDIVNCSCVEIMSKCHFAQK